MRQRRDIARLGLLLPRAGPMGMFTLAGENCAQLAMAELNAGMGLGGRFVEYVTLDAFGDPASIAARANELAATGQVDAWIGMHTSDVRVAVAAALAGRVPYIFTPMYEGGETGAAIYLVGETPEHQMQPMIAWMAEQLGSRTWYLIGNNYNYPYLSNQNAKHYIAENRGTVVGEAYIGFIDQHMPDHIAAIAHSNANSVLVNLVGSSAVDFHRAFAAAGLDENILRFCCLLEEDTLLAIGAEASRGMYTCNGYFGGLQTPHAQAFEQKYQKHFGSVAPSLNHFAVSCYEAVHVLDAVCRSSQDFGVGASMANRSTFVAPEGPRGELRIEGRHARSAAHIARADGLAISALVTI